MILEWTSGAYDQRPRYLGLAQVLTWSGVVVTNPATIIGHWHDPVSLIRSTHVDIDALRTRTDITRAERVEAT